MREEWVKKVLTEADSWLGTRWDHMQRCKGAGVDCGQFLLGVYHNIGLIPDVKTEYYPRDFMMHHDREWYTEMMEKFAQRVPPPPMPGDVVLYRVGRVFSHGGIVINWPRIIHSFRPVGVGYAIGDQGFFLKRETKFFRPFGME